MYSDGKLSKYVLVCAVLLFASVLPACSDDADSPTDAGAGGWFLRFTWNGTIRVSWAEAPVLRFERAQYFSLETDANWTTSWGNEPDTLMGYWKLSGSRLNDIMWLIDKFELDGLVQNLSTRENEPCVIFYNRSLGQYNLPQAVFRDAQGNSLMTADITVYQK